MTNYVELHCHSHYSLLDGASSPDALVRRAAVLNMPALALTDHNNLYGAVEFQKNALPHNLKPIFGSELTLANGHHLTLLVKDGVGWANLCWLITAAQHAADKGKGALPLNSLEGHTQGLIALSGCLRGEIPSAILKKNYTHALAKATYYTELFGRDNFWIELQHHRRPHDPELINFLVRLAKHLHIGYVATNNVHYDQRDKQRLQDILVCIQHNTTLDNATRLLKPNSEFYLKSGDEMNVLYAGYPQALENTLAIAQQCNFRLENTLQSLPNYPTPDGMKTGEYLEYLCTTSPRCTTDTLHQRLHHELSIIKRAGLENYFLIVWDIVRFARENGIRCQGRGSAASSVVAYLLHISPIDPLKHDLVFERFLSDERRMTPDIDIDFDASRREEVIQYVYNRYGRDYAAMACTFVTYRTKSAVRDVAKAFGFTPAVVEVVSEAWEKQASQEVVVFDGEHLRLVLELCQQLKGRPRHVGIHNGGMVICGQLLTTRLPTEPATMIDRTVVQWDKDSLEDAGIVKVDILGLRMLAAISEAVALTGVNLDTLSFDDPAVYQMISIADTIGVFQVESRAQAQMLPRFQLKNFIDIIIAISLIRPGPIMGNMVHPYLRRRTGKEVVTYLHPLLKPALAETLGVILWQEQVLKIAHDVAGFTYGQGEMLRRALGSKNAQHLLDDLETIFVEGAVKKGVERDIATEIFARLRGFGSYSFAKSHAAAFAVLVYQSAWFRRYHPAAFYVALLNNQPMGFWQPSVIINDARRHKIKVLSVHINQSQAKCSLMAADAFRIGFNYIKGLGEGGANRIVDARTAGDFKSLRDFCLRTQLPQRLVEHLIQAGAMDEWGTSRRKLLWELGTIRYKPDEFDLPSQDDEVSLPKETLADTVEMEYNALGMSIQVQETALYRDWLNKHGVLNSTQVSDCEAGSYITTAGLAIIRQAPKTANGVQFITIEDEYGFINVIVRPQIFEHFKQVIRKSPFLIVKGKIQRVGQVVNVVAHRLYRLPNVNDV